MKGKEKKRRQVKVSIAVFCRDEATRTPDPYVPNVVRYQLRYIPICIRFSEIECKGRKKK